MSIMLVVGEKQTADTKYCISVMFMLIYGLFVLILPSFLRAEKIAIKEKNNLEKELESIQNKIALQNISLDKIGKLKVDQNEKKIKEYEKIKKNLKELEKIRKQIEFKLEIIGENPTDK